MVRQTVVVGEVTTGRRLMALEVLDGSWSTGAGTDDTVQATIPLASAYYRRLRSIGDEFTEEFEDVFGIPRWVPSDTPLRDVLAVTEPKRAFMALLADDRVVAHGVIESRQWDEDAQTLSVSARGLSGSVLSKRLAIPAVVPGRVQDASLDFTGLSLGTIVKRHIEESLARPGGSLPIILPADVVGTDERHYPGYELGYLWDRVQQISKVAGGPEVALEPRMMADLMGVELALRTGTPELFQSGQDWWVDMSVPRGTLGGLTVTEDGSAIVNRAWASGTGMASALMVSSATDATASAAGYPLLETVRPYSEISVQEMLDSHAAADVAANARPWVTWKMRIPVDERLGQYRNGDYWSVRIGQNHPYLDRGVYRARMASHTGQIGGEMVDITLVPTQVGA
jgi:hypothetical protein